MKVLIVSTPFIPVPPPTYGGLERVVFDLAMALLQLGHHVTVAGPSESHLPKDVSHIDIGPAQYRIQQNWVEAEKKAYEKYKPELKDFEIIHDHSWYGWPYIAKLQDHSLKIIHTHHGHLNWRTPPPFEHPNLVGISQFMASIYHNLLNKSTRYVYNGVSLDDYSFSSQRGQRLIYLGRMAKFKQPHIAIAVAKQAGVPIDIVGGDRFVEDFNYVDYIKNECDGLHARYIGETSHDLKLGYLKKSRAIIIPSNMGEPFGLVAVEALACGRPVICFDDGALKEIVNSSVGFVCKKPEDMVEIIKKEKDLKIKPEDCRRRAELFSKERMASNYMELYRMILKGDEW